MANDIARRKKRVSGRGEAAAKTRAGSSSNKQLKHADKKRPKKAVRPGPDTVVKQEAVTYAADHGLMTAFHHMQRASVVMSLMKKGTGKDLQGLLKRGVKLYRKAVEEDANDKFVLRAIGVLRAAEHLSMAGLYAARERHRQRVTAPTPEWLTKVVVETSRRLEQIEDQERGKGADLFPVTVELVRQAKEPKLHAHLAFELAMAADALCFALENGL
jgi:hypothetical protein